MDTLVLSKKYVFNGSYCRDKEDFTYTLFEKVDFSKDAIPTTFFRSDFRGAKFIEVDFYKNNFDRADFISSIFVNSNLISVNIAACEMKNCFFHNVKFQGNMYNNTSIQECTFQECTFDKENFLINMKNCTFINCKISCCKFERSTTEKITFEKCDINESNFANMHAERYHFKECQLTDNYFDICYIFGYLFYMTDICNINIIYMGEIVEFTEDNVKKRFSINLWKQQRYYEFINSQILFGKYNNTFQLIKKAFEELINCNKFTRKLEIYNIFDMLQFYAFNNTFDFELVKSLLEYFDNFNWDVFELEERIIYLAQYEKFKIYITESEYNNHFISSAQRDISLITFHCNTNDYELAYETVAKCISKIYESLNIETNLELINVTKGSWVLTFVVISACALLLPKIIKQYTDLYVEINTKRSISNKIIEKINKKNINVNDFKTLSEIAITTGLVKEEKIELNDISKIIESIKVNI